MNIIKTGWANTCKFLDANSPYILTGLGVSGVFITTWRAIKDTIRAEEALAEKQEELGRSELTFKEKAITVVPCYASTIVSAFATVGCVVGGQLRLGGRLAAIAGLYQLRDSEVKKYRDVISEKFPEDEAEDVEKRVKGTHKRLPEVGPDDEIWFVDSFGQRFRATWADVLEAENYIIKLVMDQTCASVNDFYERLQILGIKVETCDYGDALEWTVEYPPNITCQSNECRLIDGVPHAVLEYVTDPRSRWK